MNRSDDDKPTGDEAFFSRWSRRKQQLKREDRAASTTAPTPAMPASGERAQQVPDALSVADTQPSQHQSEPQPGQRRPLTEDDFKDVDFSKLDYHSDYSRFTQAGVPEGIRQKALTQLWHSDTIFTQVDPFQDYAGDFTDAATVPKGGLVKTAYRVGQGFLTDREAHEWDRLGKPDIAADIAELPELRPGYRVRTATVEDAPTLAALQTASILSVAAPIYGDAIAQSWAQGLTADLVAERLQSGATCTVAIDETNGAIAGMLGRNNKRIEALFVAPTHGRRGIARRLIEHTLSYLQSSGASGDITVDATLLSRNLFHRLGWRELEVRMNPTRGGAALEVFAMTRPLVTDATLTITRETVDQPAVKAFFAESEAYMGGLYPAESNHFIDPSALLAPNVIFLVARLNSEPVGCGAVVKADDSSGEVKRMWVSPATRGLKLGVRILEALEQGARADGVTILRLETGILQPEAIGLYRRAGFIETGPFGSYQHDPLSLFMQKVLGPA